MKFSDKLFSFLRNALPSPLSIAILLTCFVFVLAVVVSPKSGLTAVEDVFAYWEKGLWGQGGLTFMVQMMLMLVLGHVLALTTVANRFILWVVGLSSNTRITTALVCLFTLIVAWLNWGLGLIFGAIMARKLGEFAEQNNKAINYALVGAAGYAGLMFWHGGISGSALVKVAEQGHLTSLMKGVFSDATLANLPSAIGIDITVFSLPNMLVSLLILVLLPMVVYKLSKSNIAVPQGLVTNAQPNDDRAEYVAERIDKSRWFVLVTGAIILLWVIVKWFVAPNQWQVITPNFINLSLLGLALVLHISISKFSAAVDEAIQGASGILIQFPLYFGIMGIMKSSGLIEIMSHFFVEVSTETTFPLWAFLSSGLVNVFVPSGGGQWMIQGPIIVDACTKLGVPLQKGIMALAYGDQITNMLQPFWALPLLGITKLKAQQILPYTLVLMAVGVVVYVFGLMVFY